MHDDRLDLLRHLFAIITELLEDVHEIAAQAQSHERSQAEHLSAARSVREAAQDVIYLCETVSVVAALADKALGASE